MVASKKKFDNKKKRILDAMDIALGLGLGAAAISILTQDKFGVIRNLQTQVLKESGLVQQKWWVCYGADPCDFCIGIQANNPYPLDYEVLSHPNCECGWEIEGNSKEE